MEFESKNILIVGLGISGIAAARFLKNKGAAVTVTDIAPAEDLGDHASQAQAMGVTLELGHHKIETFEGADLIVISPGVPHTIGPIERARAKSIPVWGEMELAARFIREPIVAVTGTNGKTTTTTLLGKMLTNSGFTVFVGGNIGNPLISYVDQGTVAEIVVVEVSSFQLDTIETFKPKVSVLLNITEDHMDRYSDFDAYVRSKSRVFKYQQAGDIAVLNGSDTLIRSISKEIKARKVFFYHQDNTHETAGNGATISGNGLQSVPSIYLHPPERPQTSLELIGSNLKGRHNLENAAAAALATLAVGGNLEAIQSVLNDFQGLSHRLEFITTVDDINFFNDSKATNVAAVARALETFNQPIVLIMGGLDKGGNFPALKKLVHKHAKKLIVLGEARDKIRSALGDACKEGVRNAADMKDAVMAAYHEAAPGDVVLLSPGCASFDMYSSYAQRGEDFCLAVRQLKETKS